MLGRDLAYFPREARKPTARMATFRQLHSRPDSERRTRVRSESHVLIVEHPAIQKGRVQRVSPFRHSAIKSYPYLLEKKPSKRGDEIETNVAAFLEKVDSLDISELPLLIEITRRLIERIFNLFGEDVILEELRTRDIPRWTDRKNLRPGDEQIDSSFEWLRKYYSEYLTFFGASVDRLFQFQLDRYDDKLLKALKSDIRRGKISEVTQLRELMKTKSDYLRVQRDIFPESLWELFKRLWNAEKKAVSRRKA